MTLLELLVALALAGGVITVAVRLLDQLGDSQARIDREATAAARDGNGGRVLERVLADARTTADSAQRFRGDERSASYPTLCDAPSGWAEPCRVTLLLDSLRDTSVLLVQTDRGERMETRRFAGAATFAYFDPAADTAWAARWNTSIALPAAIGVVVGFDTTVFALGPARE